MLGRISPKLAQIQETHLKRKKKRRTGKAWLRKLIRELWIMGWQMWQQRNAKVHSFSSPHFQRQLEDLRQQVRDEFSKGTTGLHKKDHHYLEEDKKESGGRSEDESGPEMDDTGGGDPEPEAPSGRGVRLPESENPASH